MAEGGSKRGGLRRPGAGRNGGAGSGASGAGLGSTEPARPDDWGLVSEAFGALRIPPDALRQYAGAEGSDDEPWDLMLQASAMDEQTALAKLAERAGLRVEPEPRLEESSTRFYEMVPPSMAREHSIAGVSASHGVIRIATSQPM